jgi:hypothetical protein
MTAGRQERHGGTCMLCDSAAQDGLCTVLALYDTKLRGALERVCAKYLHVARREP